MSKSRKHKQFRRTLHRPITFSSRWYTNTFPQTSSSDTKITGLPTARLSELLCEAVTRVSGTTAQDVRRPLSHHFTVVPSGRRDSSPRGRERLSAESPFYLQPCQP